MLHSFSEDKFPLRQSFECDIYYTGKEYQCKDKLVTNSVVSGQDWSNAPAWRFWRTSSRRFVWLVSALPLSKHLRKIVLFSKTALSGLLRDCSTQSNKRGTAAGSIATREEIIVCLTRTSASFNHRSTLESVGSPVGYSYFSNLDCKLTFPRSVVVRHHISRAVICHRLLTLVRSDWIL